MRLRNPADLMQEIVFSFNDSTHLSFPLRQLTTRWSRELIEAGGLLESLNNCLVVGVVSSALATLLGTMAAMDLGASFWGAQLRVTLPISLPALVAAFLTCFTTSFDEYAMSVFLVGTDATLPIYVYS